MPKELEFGSIPEFFAQPRLDVLPREIATRLLTGGQCPPVMVTANAFVSLIGAADGCVDVMDYGRKAGRIARVFDDQGRLGNARCRLG